MNQPEYDGEGEPINIEAAATDAMEWLRMLHRWLSDGFITLDKHDENVERLGATVRALERFTT
jgi:hypothetical protein